LLAAGAEVRAASKASETAKKIFGDRIKIETDPYEALRGADAMVVITEWNEFRRPDFKQIKELLAQPYVFDGRNIYNPETMRSMGFNYFCIGRP